MGRGRSRNAWIVLMIATLAFQSPPSGLAADANDILQKLLCHVGQTCNAPPGGATRGLTPVLDRQQQQEAIGKAAQLGGLPSIDLDIYFAFDSAKIARFAIHDLEQLGQALSDPRLGAAHFALVGHTDYHGSVDYNQQLSEARANAIRDFIVIGYRIDPARLQAYGVGALDPKDPSDPFSALNRRVQIVNIGSLTIPKE